MGIVSFEQEPSLIEEFRVARQVPLTVELVRQLERPPIETSAGALIKHVAEQLVMSPYHVGHAAVKALGL